MNKLETDLTFASVPLRVGKVKNTIKLQDALDIVNAMSSEFPTYNAVLKQLNKINPKRSYTIPQILAVLRRERLKWHEKWML